MLRIVSRSSAVIVFLVNVYIGCVLVWQVVKRLQGHPPLPREGFYFIGVSIVIFFGAKLAVWLWRYDPRRRSSRDLELGRKDYGNNGH